MSSGLIGWKAELTPVATARIDTITKLVASRLSNAELEELVELMDGGAHDEVFFALNDLNADRNGHLYNGDNERLADDARPG